MALTKSQWLRKQNVFRCVLVEVDYKENGTLKTAYFARGNFRTAATDSPSYSPYRDFIIGGLQFSQSISEVFSGKSSVDFGSVNLVYHSETEALLTKAVAGNQIRIYIGEESWKKSEFHRLATVTSKRVWFSSNSINIGFRDFSEDLDKPVLTAKTSNQELIPLASGRCFNIRPVLDDAAIHRYKFNVDSSQAITAVKMNGDVMPTSNYSVDLANSTATFSVKPYGEITFDVDGYNAGGWKSTVAEMITWMFPGAQVDPVVPAYMLGIYVDSDMSKDDLLDLVTTSAGCFWYFTEFGVLHVKPFKLPTNSSQKVLSDAHNASGTRKISRQFSPVKQVDLQYSRNFTELKNVAGAVYTADANMAERLKNKYQVESKSNNTLADYSDAAITSPETNIVNKADAATEAQRRLDIAVKPRFIYQTKQLAAGFELQLGDEVKLDTPGVNGDYAIIVRKIYDILNESVTLEFWQ